MPARAAVDELLLAGNQLGINAPTATNPGSSTIRDNLNAAPKLEPIQVTPDAATLRTNALNSYLGQSALPGTLPPDVQNSLKAIQSQLATAPQLQQLDAGAKGSLDAITAGNQAKFDLNQTQVKQDLLNKLFGNGTNRSTIALDEGGRLAYGQGANQAQLLADAASRELGLRTDASNRFLQNQQLQAGVVGQQGEIGLQEINQQNQAQAQRGNLLSQLLGQNLTQGVSNAELGANERNRLQQDAQFREGNVINLAQGRSGIQNARKSGLEQALAGGLSLASFALPGGGSIGGSLLSKIPGLGK